MAASTVRILINSKITNQHNHINHINFSDNFRPHSHSFGQVSLPIKTDQKISISSSSSSSSLRQSSVSAALFATRARPTEAAPRLAEMWREIQGCDDWEDLVEPLNPLLRREIIRYGEFVAASYKAFDLDPASKRYLNCKYGKKRMLRETGMESSGYEVTKYIYATPDIDMVQDQAGGSGATARWIGYVAVATDETAKRLGRRDVVVTFRGTVTNPEWIANLMSSLTPARLDPHDPRPDVKVESGFLSLYTSGESSSKFGPESCREQLLSEVSRLLSEHHGEEMSLTLAGHSMGSSLANLLAYDIAELGLNRRNPSGRGEEDQGGAVPVTVFSFGGPRVGNLGFKQRCEELGVKVLRVVNVNDPITKMPGVLFNENFRVSLGGKYEFPWSCSCYAHVGVELVLDFFNVQNPSCVHDLDTYINLLKCPKRSSSSQSHHDDDPKMIRWDHNNVVNNIIGGEFFNRAKDLILSAQESFNMLPWVSAAGNMVNLVQSQRT